LDEVGDYLSVGTDGQTTFDHYQYHTDQAIKHPENPEEHGSASSDEE
jgi:hypothetical protein